IRQSGFALYHQRLRRAQVPLRGARRQYRHQHRGCRADGLFPLQRMEGKLFRHSSWPGTRCRGIFHRIENRDRALVAPGNPQVLKFRGALLLVRRETTFNETGGKNMIKKAEMCIGLCAATFVGLVVGLYAQSNSAARLTRLSEDKAEISKMDWV